jgi:Outer membrane protein beta-barrel domain
VRKSYLLICAALLSASVAAATDFPTMETFLGYNFARFNPNSGYAPSFNANGGSGQFEYNFNRFIGVAVDLGAVNNGRLNQTSVDTTVVDFVAGPRYTLRMHHSRFMPYAQVLVGGAYSTTSTAIAVFPVVPVSGPFGNGVVVGTEPITARVNASNTGFALLAGGGLDIKLGKHIAFRPVEASYYLTRIPSLLTGNTTNRNNFRYAAGVNFMFGAK